MKEEEKFKQEDSSWIDNIIKEHQKQLQELNKAKSNIDNSQNKCIFSENDFKLSSMTFNKDGQPDNIQSSLNINTSNLNELNPSNNKINDLLSKNSLNSINILNYSNNNNLNNNIKLGETNTSTLLTNISNIGTNIDYNILDKQSNNNVPLTEHGGIKSCAHFKNDPNNLNSSYSNKNTNRNILTDMNLNMVGSISTTKNKTNLSNLNLNLNNIGNNAIISNPSSVNNTNNNIVKQQNLGMCSEKLPNDKYINSMNGLEFSNSSNLEYDFIHNNIKNRNTINVGNTLNNLTSNFTNNNLTNNTINNNNINTTPSSNIITKDNNTNNYLQSNPLNENNFNPGLSNNLNINNDHDINNNNNLEILALKNDVSRLTQENITLKSQLSETVAKLNKLQMDNYTSNSNNNENSANFKSQLSVLTNKISQYEANLESIKSQYEAQIDNFKKEIDNANLYIHYIYIFFDNLSKNVFPELNFDMQSNEDHLIELKEYEEYLTKIENFVSNLYKECNDYKNKYIVLMEEKEKAHGNLNNKGDIYDITAMTNFNGNFENVFENNFENYVKNSSNIDTYNNILGNDGNDLNNLNTNGNTNNNSSFKLSKQNLINEENKENKEINNNNSNADNYNIYKTLEQRVNLLEKELNLQKKMNNNNNLNINSNKKEKVKSRDIRANYRKINSHNMNDLSCENKNIVMENVQFKNDTLVQKMRPKSGVRMNRENMLQREYKDFNNEEDVNIMTNDDCNSVKKTKKLKKKKKNTGITNTNIKEEKKGHINSFIGLNSNSKASNKNLTNCGNNLCHLNNKNNNLSNNVVYKKKGNKLNKKSDGKVINKKK